MSDGQKTSFSLKNDRSEELPIFVEPWPEFYKLRKHETLRILFEPRSDVSDAIEIVAHDDGLTLYPNFVDDAEITIDGKDTANRSWSD